MRSRNSRALVSGLVMALCCSLAIPGLAGGAEGLVGNKIVIKNFVLPQLREDGEKDWVLRAMEGVSSGNSILLKTMHMILYREVGGQLELRSPECLFDQQTKTGRSDKMVNIRSETMVIDGVGFDLDGQRKSIVIRSKVRVKIFRTDENLFGNPSK